MLHLIKSLAALNIAALENSEFQYDILYILLQRTNMKILTLLKVLVIRMKSDKRNQDFLHFSPI